MKSISNPPDAPHIKQAFYDDNNSYHRDDGPAVLFTNGAKCWYKHGKLHRLDRPAIESAFIDAWYVDGKSHNEYGSAQIYLDGTEKWYIDGLLHRLDGPAVINSDGSKEWFRDSQRSRFDGPAITNPDGTKRWFLFGKELTEEKYNEQLAKLDKE